VALLRGLVSERSVWGSLWIPPWLRPIAAGAVGFISDLGARSVSGLFSRLEEILPLRRKPVPAKQEPERPGPSKLEVTVRGPKRRKFRYGETIRLSLTVPEDGHMVVVHYGQESGDIEVILPGFDRNSTVVTRSKTVEIVRKPSSTPGRYGFKVIFTRQSLVPSAETIVGTGQQVEQGLLSLIEQLGTLDAKEWREADFEYEVVA